jgi:Arc/MetJ family transcription regulator
MVSNMKTTIDISDALLDEARKVAAREGTTVKALVEQGLRRVLSERKRGTAFRLRNATFRGNGLQSGLDGTDWERIRALAYEGRGG